MEKNSLDLICYLSNGYPSHTQTLENAAAYIKGGCDVIEVDIPCDNPYIDGPLLQERMIASYHEDPSLKSHVDTIYKLRERFKSQRFILLAYEKTVQQIGVEAFIKIYHDNGIESLILVDTKSYDVKRELMKHDVKVVSYVPLEDNEQALEDAKASNGFVYLQAKSSTAKENALKCNIERLRSELEVGRKIYCGVGISTVSDIELLRLNKADGAFVGSAVFTKEGDLELMSDFIKELKSATIL